MTGPPRPDDHDSDPGLRTLIGERRHLTNLAYRLLGSLAEAEEVWAPGDPIASRSPATHPTPTPQPKYWCRL